jgi:DNA mismatch repair protein MutS2
MAVVEANNELRELESREQHEIERILAELSADCAAVSDVISRDYHAITELAFIFAKAELSLRLDATAPALTEERCVELYRARHPLLDKKQGRACHNSFGEGRRQRLYHAGCNWP